MAMAVYGIIRVPAGEAPLVPGITLRLVQPNIAQSDKWNADTELDHVRLLLALSRQPQPPGAAPVTTLVWPETAVPYLLEDEPELLKAVAQVTPPGGLTLTGSLRLTPAGSPGAQDNTDTYWNSLVVVNDQGRALDHYDKAHLVPFGEYTPFRHWLPLRAVALVAPSNSILGAGAGPRTLDLPGLPPVSPLICYEVIFPGAVTAQEAGTKDAQRPQWLLNVTNDAWYGQTAGPHQHLAIATMRAIEEGLPLVRAANTGISAVVDPYGRVLGHLALGTQESSTFRYRSLYRRLHLMPDGVMPPWRLYSWLYWALSIFSRFGCIKAGRAFEAKWSVAWGPCISRVVIHEPGWVPPPYHEAKFRDVGGCPQGKGTHRNKGQEAGRWDAGRHLDHPATPVLGS